MNSKQKIFEKFPQIQHWLQETVRKYNPQAKRVFDYGFSRIPQFCRDSFLQSSKLVEVEQLPLPPLLEWGLDEYEDFLHEPFVGITYLETIFLLRKERGNESVVFHELVHVAQWRFLGVERFLTLYVLGFLQERYYGNPLELMAYQIQEDFEERKKAFDLEERVQVELKKLSTPQAAVTSSMRFKGI